jgi:hypothetical protein
MYGGESRSPPSLFPIIHTHSVSLRRMGPLQPHVNRHPSWRWQRPLRFAPLSPTSSASSLPLLLLLRAGGSNTVLFYIPEGLSTRTVVIGSYLRVVNAVHSDEITIFAASA